MPADSQPINFGPPKLSLLARAVRAWQLVVLRRFIATLISPVDRLEWYHPPYRPSFYYQLHPNVQKRFNPWDYILQHPLGLPRDFYERFWIWPGVLVVSRFEINQAINDERSRQLRKSLRVLAPQRMICYLSKKCHPQPPLQPRQKRQAP